MLRAALHGRESIVSLFGSRFRRGARGRHANPLRPRSIVKDDALFTRAMVVLVPQTHIVEIKFPVLVLCGPPQPPPVGGLLGLFKEWLISEASLLDRDVEDKHEYLHRVLVIRLISALFSSVFVSPSSHASHLSFVQQEAITQWNRNARLFIACFLHCAYC